MKIVLTETQLNSLVETDYEAYDKTVFKDEEKLKDEVDTHISEDSEKCKCECNEDGEDCKCPPECEECDCNEKELGEWNPNESVPTQPGGLMQGAMFPKWIQENKNNFKRLIK